MSLNIFATDYQLPSITSSKAYKFNHHVFFISLLNENDAQKNSRYLTFHCFRLYDAKQRQAMKIWQTDHFYCRGEKFVYFNKIKTRNWNCYSRQKSILVLYNFDSNHHDNFLQIIATFPPQNHATTFFQTHPNFAVSGFIIASCIRRRVTSNGYEKDWARAPAKPPHSSFAGTERTRPPKTNNFSHESSTKIEGKSASNLCSFRVCCTWDSASISCTHTWALQSSRRKVQHTAPFP